MIRFSVMSAVCVLLLTAQAFAQAGWKVNPQPWEKLPVEIREGLQLGNARFSDQIPDSPFGAHTVMLSEGVDNDRIEQVLGLYAATGMKWVKDYTNASGLPREVEAEWEKTGKVPESLVPDRYMTFFKTARRLGLKVLLRIDANIGNDNDFSPEVLANYTRFLKMFVSQTKDYVDAWEIDNETNIGKDDPPFYRMTPEEYVSLVEAGYKGIRAADPKAKILGGAASMLQCLDKYPYPYFDRMLKAGLLKYCDVFSFHPYRQPYRNNNIPEHASEFYPWRIWKTYEAQIVDLKARLKKASGRDFPIAATEVGYPASFNKESKQRTISLQTQAKYDLRMMIMDHYLGVYPRINFAFKRQVRDLYNVEAHFTMMNPDWIRQPNYFATTALCSMIDSRDTPVKFPCRITLQDGQTVPVKRFAFLRTDRVNQTEYQAITLAVWLAVEGKDFRSPRIADINMILPDDQYGAPVLCDLMTLLTNGPKPLRYEQSGREYILKNVPLNDYPVLIRLFKFAPMTTTTSVNQNAASQPSEK